MNKIIFLDSGPLSLLAHRLDLLLAQECRAWMARHVRAGNRVLIPEIIDYELRRELLHAGKLQSVSRLDAIATTPDFYLPLTTPAIRLAADLWAKVRNQGLPTTNSQELDVDVILAAQVLITNANPLEKIVATTNINHLSRFVNADLWQNIAV